jgi:hypothetical protein
MVRKALFLCAAFIAALAMCASAKQQLVWDGDITWDGSSGSYKADWQGDPMWKDLGYASGELYVRVEVTEMKQDPTSSKFYFQMCNWNGGEMCMSCGTLKFNTLGVYSCNQAPNSWWTKSPASFNDHYGKMKFVLKYNGKWAQSNSRPYTYGPGIMNVVPVKTHVTVINATAGEPADISAFDWPCPAEWECSGGSVSAQKSAIAAKQNAAAFDIIGKTGNHEIRFNNFAGPKQVHIYTMSGMLVRSISVRSGAPSCTIDGSVLRSGIYTIIVRENENTSARTLVDY